MKSASYPNLNMAAFTLAFLAACAGPPEKAVAPSSQATSSPATLASAPAMASSQEVAPPPATRAAEAIPARAVPTSQAAPTVTPAAPAFSPTDRAAIQAYYGTQAAPGQSGRYKAGDTLDYDARPMPTPTALKARLAHPPEPYSVLVVGSDLILLDRATRRIADVVPDAVR